MCFEDKKSKCKDFLPGDWKYSCLNQSPLHSGLKTKIFEVTQGSEVYTMKVVKLDVHASNELSILKKLSNNKYLTHLYVEKQVDNFLVMILDNGKYDNMYKAIDEKSEFHKEKFKLEFFKKLLDAVEHIHKAGYSHNDLNPGNILVLKNLDPMVIDFKNSSKLNLDGKGFKSTLYTAPECIEAFEKDEPVFFDEKIDVFSLGAILYYIFLDDTPVRDIDTYSQLVESQVTFPSKTPRIVAEIVQGCFTLKDNRYDLTTLRRMVDKAIGLSTLPTLGIEYRYQINSNRNLDDDFFFQKYKNVIFILFILVMLGVGLFFVKKNWSKLEKIEMGVEIKEKKIDIETPMQ
jgi:serine/threonine protein kinase